MKTLLCWISCLCLLSACRNNIPPSEQLARAFVEAYYVEIDLKKAHGLAQGLAASKIQESLDLTQGQAPGAEALKPGVDFTLTQREPEEQNARYVFELKIRPKNFPLIRRQVMVRVRYNGEKWAVTQFTDDELRQVP